MTKEKVAFLSIIANLFLAGFKILVGLFSKSTAVLATGLDSFSDIFSSTINFLGIKISKKPADKKHPFGHWKFEVLAGASITLILLITGIFILKESFKKFKNPRPIEMPFLALFVMAISATINAIMSQLKLYYGKKENSMALISDGVHSRIDVFTSLAVFGGLILAKYWIFIDSILALLIGLYIIKESFSLGKEAIDSLLDVSAPPEIEEKIKSVVKSQGINLESLKTQKKGSAFTANLEINLPSNLKVEEASKISENLREKLMKEIKNLVYVTIQIKSHELETGFFKPTFLAFGRGFGWQRRHRYGGKGPGGFCVCLKCGYKIEHQRGIPCSTLTCPNCKITLKRE